MKNIRGLLYLFGILISFSGEDKLLETDWLTQKFDFSDFDPALADTSETLQELSQVEHTEFLADLNDTLLSQPMGEELLSISIEMPTTPEQKVPEFAVVSPYSVDSAASPVTGSHSSSLSSSPCSPYSDSGSESTVSLTDLLKNDDGSFASLSPSKQTESIDSKEENNTSIRATPYARTTSLKTTTKPKGKTPAQRQRKRVQNKDAATRYRVKKRSEQDKLFEVAEGIEQENSKLKDQVASISKEIEYLKNLMLEVYKTKKKKEQATSLKVA